MSAFASYVDITWINAAFPASLWSQFDDAGTRRTEGRRVWQKIGTADSTPLWECRVRPSELSRTGCHAMTSLISTAARSVFVTFMTFKALHTGRPPYLTHQLQYYQPTRSLRSSGSRQLVKPRHNLSFGSRAFRISAPHIWNSLPTNIREAQSLLTFRRHLETHYFQSAFSTP